ncbi:MAG: glycoside hydrolase family 15 protein [Candidatus Dormibacteria bacterium]
MQHAIGDHALLADGRTAALIDPDGNVAWLCWPRIDSTPCLLSILDPAVGGSFVVAPADPGASVVERGYVPGTLILRTVWRVGRSQLIVHDALACDGAPRLLRSLRANGQVEVAVTLSMAPDAARATPRPSAAGAVLQVDAGAAGLDLAVHAPASWSLDERGVAACRFTLDSSEGAVILCGAASAAPSGSLEGTRHWFATRLPAAAALAPSPLAASTLGESTARALVVQSAAVLAALQQRDGGIVAAPTTSLPQWPASSRTWDYRYSWLRDTALAALAMLRTNLVEEAAGLGDFIGEAARAVPPAVLLRVDGTAPPPEQRLDHLGGYRGARPVRIGNAAAEQPQLDVAGEILELAAALAARDVLPRSLRAGAVRVADWTADNWTQADHGIWEIRGSPRHYTHSRVAAWAGLVQAAALGARGAVEGDAERWRRTAAAIRSGLLSGEGPLTLHDQGGGPDAALAQAVLFGLFAEGDRRREDTLDAILSQLSRHGLVDRHLAAEDPLDEPCAPFLFPTFWVAEALHRCGRDGSPPFAAAAASRGPLDLFGEVADPADHTPLGNYPQVQSHAAFVLAATEPDPPG